MNGSAYTDPDELRIVTLENAVYMSMKNDLAFLADFHLYLYEHQSTVNSNMPLRFLQYVAREYEKLTGEDSLYRRKRIVLPACGNMQKRFLLRRLCRGRLTSA